LFGGQDKRTFQHQIREHPLYFSFRHQIADDVTIELPAQLAGEQLAATDTGGPQGAGLCFVERNQNGSLHLKRELSVAALLVDAKYYDAMHDFFEIVAHRR